MSYCKAYRRTKDHLVLDKVSVMSYKARKKKLAVAWIDDYQKVYDLVPLSRILEQVRMTGVADDVQKVMRNSMKQRKTNL